MHMGTSNAKFATSPFRVLDIAGTGRSMVPTYSKLSAKSQRAFCLKSIDILNEDINVCIGSCSITWQKAPLQDQLKKEPRGYYDHIHLHSPLGKFTGAEIADAFSNINRIMKQGGYLFFSMDDFKVAVGNNEHEFAILLAADRIRNDYAQCLSYLYAMRPDEDASRRLRSIIGNDFTLPKMEEITRFFGAERISSLPLKDFVHNLFSRFTENLHSVHYYAIAQKKE